MKFHPAIVIVGYNRPHSLKRLLQYLTIANYPESDVQLVISLDYSGTDEGKSTRQVAEDFQWTNGDKRLIIRDENIGLRQHVLECGDLSQEYGSVIVLEDDLSVGPEFYRYSQAALEFSCENKNVAGVSLYNHNTNFICQLPFVPVHDGYDNYYLKIASSWGQAWTQKQWQSFRNWYGSLEHADGIPGDIAIPKRVKRWPESSWLKYFIAYLEKTNRFFLYPRVGHATNHNDSGTHVAHGSSVWQVPLALATRGFRFSTPEDSLSVYDSYFELLPSKFVEISAPLSEYKFNVDLYGTKSNDALVEPLTLTSKKPQGESILQFDLSTKPMESNFQIESLESGAAVFSLCETRSVGTQENLSLSNVFMLEYFFGMVPLRKVSKHLISYFWQKRNRD